jgi:hypothetical protein
MSADDIEEGIMAGPIAKTQPKKEDRPQHVGDLQPDVSRQFDDAPPSDLVQPQPQTGEASLPEAEAHPEPGMSKNLNTGEEAKAKRGG